MPWPENGLICEEKPVETVIRVSPAFKLLCHRFAILL